MIHYRNSTQRGEEGSMWFPFIVFTLCALIVFIGGTALGEYLRYCN